MTPYQEIKSALVKLSAEEHILKNKLKEIEKLKIKIAFILGGGEWNEETETKPKRKYNRREKGKVA